MNRTVETILFVLATIGAVGFVWVAAGVEIDPCCRIIKPAHSHLTPEHPNE